MKSLTSTSSFTQKKESKDDSSMAQVAKIYQSEQRARSSSKSQKRALTPKVKQSKRVVIMPIEEKNEDDLEKE